MSLGDALAMSEALLHRLDEHLTHRLAWQAFAFPGPVSQDLPVTAVLGEATDRALYSDAPPQINSSCPVIAAADGDSRYWTRSATSCGWM